MPGSFLAATYAMIYDSHDDSWRYYERDTSNRRMGISSSQAATLTESQASIEKVSGSIRLFQQHTGRQTVRQINKQTNREKGTNDRRTRIIIIRSNLSDHVPSTLETADIYDRFNIIVMSVCGQCKSGLPVSTNHSDIRGAWESSIKNSSPLTRPLS